MVFLSDFIEFAESDAQVQQSVLIMDKKDRHTMTQLGQVNETNIEILLNELLQHLLLESGEQVQVSW